MQDKSGTFNYSKDFTTEKKEIRNKMCFPQLVNTQKVVNASPCFFINLYNLNISKVNN